MHPCWPVHLQTHTADVDACPCLPRCLPLCLQPEWLTESGTPLCVLSEEPLADPPPAYRGGTTDAVVAYREARYGLHGWALPSVAAPHPNATERAAVFGAALLEGRVLQALAGTVGGEGGPAREVNRVRVVKMQSSVHASRPP